MLNCNVGPSKIWPELTSLALDLRYPEEVVELLACKKTLTSLTIAGPKEPVDPKYYKYFRNLKHLDLSLTKWSHTSFIEGLYGMQQLESLNLSGGIFDKKQMSDLMNLEGTLPNLKKLDVSDLVVSSTGKSQVIAKLKGILERRKQRQPGFEFDVSAENYGASRDFFNSDDSNEFEYDHGESSDLMDCSDFNEDSNDSIDISEDDSNNSISDFSD